MYSKEEIEEAMEGEESVRPVLLKLGIPAEGWGYEYFRSLVREHALNITNLTGSYSKKANYSPGRRYTLEDVLSNKFYIPSCRLKKKLISNGTFEKKCYRCKRAQWEGQDIVLELEHIDGNRRNNSLENLTLLCPNCHSLTSTWRGRNKAQRTRLCKTCSTSVSTYRVYCDECLVIKLREHKNKERKIYSCIDCLAEVKWGIKRCKFCYHEWSAKHLLNSNTKISWPNDEELSKLVWSKAVTQLAVDFGISDKAIAKHCKKRNIAIPPRGYWAKRRAGKV